MANKPELLQCRAANEVGQEFLFVYQRAVLLSLQQQGILNEMQFMDCVRKLEQQIKQQTKHTL